MNDTDLAAILPDTSVIGETDIGIGGCSLNDLAEEFGTPLYVYDEQTVRAAISDVRRAFDALGARISFAAKACALTALLRIFREEKLGLDVVSEGELVAGMRAGFLPGHIHLHGNYKSAAEISAAVHLRLHAIVVDNLEELRAIDRVCDQIGAQSRIMLRLALPLEAETHPALMTAGRHTKFGLSMDEEAEAIRWISGNPRLSLTGLHAHLGSQIADAAMYERAAESLVEREQVLTTKGFAIEELSVGGGWAVPYTPKAPALCPGRVAEAIRVPFASSGARPAIEPGRFLIARAGVAVYRVGSVKTTSTGRIVAVDGGMADNPRPALYGASYTPVVVTSPRAAASGPGDIVGRYCESGDVLARNVPLPSLHCGQLIAMPVAGAYQLSMASGYNLVPLPAAVLVQHGNARLVSRRGTIDDLLARNVERDGF